MAKRNYHVPILPHWDSSDDVLLKALRSNGGELYSALESVKGQVSSEKSGPTDISLQYSRITDDGCEALAGLTELTAFTSSQRMTDAALVHLRGMVKLRALVLNEMRLTGDGLRHLGGMSQLTSLQICACTLSDDALAHLPALPALTSFSLSGSAGCTDAALECLIRLENLEQFSLNGAPAAGPGLRHLASLHRLRQLDLSSGHSRSTTDEDLASIPMLPTVEYLSLRDTPARHQYQRPQLYRRTAA